MLVASLALNAFLVGLLVGRWWEARKECGGVADAVGTVIEQDPDEYGDEDCMGFKVSQD